MEIIGWRVYCAGGETYTANPAAIPLTVQGVVFFHSPPYRTVSYGVDTYTVDGVELIGSLLPDDEFETVRQAMMADEVWP